MDDHTPTLTKTPLLIHLRRTARTIASAFAERFFNLETVIALYRLPIYGYALWRLDPTPLPVFPYFDFAPHQFGWVILAIALDRCVTPLFDLLGNPVKRQAKRELAVAMSKTRLSIRAYRKKSCGDVGGAR